MKILVANLGSTSFKYRLYDLGDPSEPLLARGSVERIGSPNSNVKIVRSEGDIERVRPVADHGEALSLCLEQLTETGVVSQPSDVAAIGFKAVHALRVSGVQLVDDHVLEAMETFSAVAPAHNPPYIKSMRMLSERFPGIPLVAAFETGFHQSAPEANQRYAIPEDWATRLGVRRYGFHGASHRYIAERMAVLLGRKEIKIISCHLGGSSSICGIKHGRSIGASMGMSPQSGLPQNNRVGDFDIYALPVILKETGLTLEQALETLANKSGLEGMSTVGGDLRDIEAAADRGNSHAQLALDHFIAAIRHYLGGYLVELNGADAIVFTGGIGENSSRIRAGVCQGLDWFGIELDPVKNAKTKGEGSLSTSYSKVQIWAVPTNEEIIVARQSRDLLVSLGNKAKG